MTTVATIPQRPGVLANMRANIPYGLNTELVEQLATVLGEGTSVRPNLKTYLRRALRSLNFVLS